MSISGERQNVWFDPLWQQKKFIPPLQLKIIYPKNTIIPKKCLGKNTFLDLGDLLFLYKNFKIKLWQKGWFFGRKKNFCKKKNLNIKIPKKKMLFIIAIKKFNCA